MTFKKWTMRARVIAADQPSGKKLFRAWEVLLAFVLKKNHWGACHDTSAVLYMLLKELGLSPTLNIGEVRAPAGFLDHSWVEVEGRIFDVAVCLPQPGGTDVGGPIFANIDVATNRKTALQYGAVSPHGFGLDAYPALSLDLSGFSTIQNEPNIWALAVALGFDLDLNLTCAELERKYGAVRRTVRKTPSKQH